MRNLSSRELRQLYLDFFRSKGHAVIPSASLIPENDPTVLFTTAGMHPLVPYLMGQKHPAGTRLTDVQKCVRTGDIDEVGDTSHCTFFEMLGNWSLGDYFKKESIAWSWEFLTDEKWLGIPKEKLSFTCFEGDADAPRDTVSHDRWVEMGADPCPDCKAGCDCGKYLEIWNNVFMEYNKVGEGKFEPLAQKNVDTGMGLDRTIATLQGVESVFDTDAFAGIIELIGKLSHHSYKESDATVKAFRIIADHIRCATFILGDQRGVTPSNVDQGYILRRLIRRSIRYAMQLNIPRYGIVEIASAVIDQYGDIYPELEENREKVLSELKREENRFADTLKKGIKEFNKTAANAQDGKIDGISAFHLYDTYGFPIELTMELAQEKGITVDVDGFHAAFAEHQKKSQAGATQRFKSGLADHQEATTALHSATHLLHKALRVVLNDDTISQKGSNITAERLRFDFSFPRKLTPEELKAVEDLVNEQIQRHMPITCEEMTVAEAKAQGAIGLFESKYGERVKVYTMGDFSKEICGGPHAENTGDLGHFVIKKEEASSSGVRRIKAILEK